MQAAGWERPRSSPPSSSRARRWTPAATSFRSAWPCTAVYTAARHSPATTWRSVRRRSPAMPPVHHLRKRTFRRGSGGCSPAGCGTSPASAGPAWMPSSRRLQPGTPARHGPLGWGWPRWATLLVVALVPDPQPLACTGGPQLEAAWEESQHARFVERRAGRPRLEPRPVVSVSLWPTLPGCDRPASTREALRRARAAPRPSRCLWRSHPITRARLPRAWSPRAGDGAGPRRGAEPRGRLLRRQRSR